MISSVKHNRLSPQQLESLINKENKLYLIHILGDEYFRLFHLPQSLNACVYEVTFIEQVEAITKEREAPIVLYGSSSNSKDSICAAEKLERAGYKNIQILDGGIEKWRNEGKPLEGIDINRYIDPGTRLNLGKRDGIYKVNIEQSIIKWAGRNPNSIHTGAVKLSDGAINVSCEKFSGKFKIDMESITNFDLEGDELQPVLISHLKSDDFFLTKLFPTATFEILDASPVDDPFLSSPNFEVKGCLELKGLKLKQDFLATVTKIHPDGISAEAHFDIDRTRWGVIYGSTRFFEHLGMHLVFDLISIQIKIVASV